ncbi:MAG: sialate O-acetylesterase, partial [Bacteroidota bacterium]
MKQFKFINLVILLQLFALPVMADVVMPRIFGSNMVLQQNKEVPVWGWANPGEKVSLQFNDQKLNTKADIEGKWEIVLKSMIAGGPYTMTIKGENTITFDNVMIGEVWICSGQSNMEWPVERSLNAEKEIANADYPSIRLFTVEHEMSPKPLEDLTSGEWAECSPLSIPNFSAVGYFFGRNLHEHLDVPVGLISTNWGGTNVETWTSAETMINDVDFSERIKELAGGNLEEIFKKNEKEMEEWQRSLKEKDAGMKAGKYVWSDPDNDFSSWKNMKVPGNWEAQGLEGVDGVVWFKTKFTLPDGVAEKGLLLSLGAIDDSDNTFVNGVQVGQTYNKYNTPRKYEVREEVLKEGENTLVVRIEDYTGGGGMHGEPSDLFIESGQFKKSLAGEWKYKVGLAAINNRPRQAGPNSYPTLLFNGMINPIIPYGIRGAIWYQGESNASRAYQYRRLFKNMIIDWRMHWKQGDFPFLFVQLANFMEPSPEPRDAEWAELREAQTMALSLPATGMASAIDIGEADDIHPRNKQDVGYRLSLAARKIAYNEDIVYSGPMY